MRNPARHLTSDQRGAALLEVTVVIPVVLAIGLGVMEFGNAIYSKHLIANGVRDGARYAAGRPADCACDADIKNIAMKGVLSGGAYRVSWWDNPATEVSVARTTVANDDGAGNKLYRGGATIPVVTVTATVPYQQLGFLSFFGLNAPLLSVSHEERVFGVR
ncbi:MAG: TadE/TadG family type IV pilus assembly protein [Aestuariivirga sp.]